MYQKIRGLYAITPDTMDTGHLLAITQQALLGGAQLIQYRNKTANNKLRLEQAQALRSLCWQYSALFIINDHLEIALAVDADGIHLGVYDISVTTARKILGFKKIIGVSCYNRLESALVAEMQQADYVAFGAFFASVTKPKTVIASIDLLCIAKQKLSIPIVAIGGITCTNATTLVHHGCNAVAVSNALFATKNIQSTAKAFSILFCKNENL